MDRNIFDLTGKVAIVTGSSRGLGQYFSKALARAGADLVITSRTRDSLEDTKQEIESIGRNALPLELDVRNEESIRNMVAATIDHYGAVDILVNNAGCNIRKPAVEVAWGDWDLVVDTNLKGAFFVATAVAKKMISRKYGRIINIGSLTSVLGFGGVAPYCASRGGIKQMTMSLAAEWGDFGITVNCLAPGFFKTAQTAVLYENKEWVDYITDRIPLNRPGMPNDMDGTVVFLASNASEYISGQTIIVDGGMTTGAMNVGGKK